MIEVGNAPDFECASSAVSLAMCQTHFTMWTIMKAPLILGNNIPAMDAATLAILTNADAIGVNQDALGVQARRVAVAAPANTSLTTLAWDNVGVIARCDASRPTQTWFWQNVTGTVRDQLFLVPCDASDAFQQWSFDGAAGATVLKNAGNGLCVDAASTDPAQTLACNPADTKQQWTLQASGHIASNDGYNCLDVFDFSGPDVEIGGCKVREGPWGGTGGVPCRKGGPGMASLTLDGGCWHAGRGGPGTASLT